MSQLTRRAIIECTLDLAEKKPLRKITVKDIVSACGITRNTFYYHFHDIYEVLDCAIDEAIGDLSVTDERPREQVIFSLIEFAVKHKKVFYNIYRSIGHEAASRLVIERLDKVMLQSIERLTAGKTIDPRDIRLICSFYEEALFGVMVRWMKHYDRPGAEEQLADDIRRIEVIFRGNLELNIRNIEESPRA